MTNWLLFKRRPYKRIQQRPFFHFVLHTTTTTTTIYNLLLCSKHNTHNTLITTMHAHFFLKVMFVLVLLLSLHVHHLCSAQQQQQQRRQEPFQVNTFVQVLTMGLAIAAPAFLFLTSQQQQYLSNENVSTSVETPFGFANTTTTKLSCCPLSEEYNSTTSLKPPLQNQKRLDWENETQSSISLLAMNHSSSMMMHLRPANSHWAQSTIQRAFPSSLSIVHSTDNRTLFLYISYAGCGPSCLRPRLDIYGVVFFHGTPSLAGPSDHVPEYTKQQLATFDGHSHLLHAMFPTRLALPSPVSTHTHPHPPSKYLFFDGFTLLVKMIKSPRRYALRMKGLFLLSILLLLPHSLRI